MKVVKKRLILSMKKFLNPKEIGNSRTLSVIRDCPQSYIAQILCNIMCDK